MNRQFQQYPSNRPPRYNGGTLCDMWVGPCACGAWHDGIDDPLERDAHPKASPPEPRPAREVTPALRVAADFCAETNWEPIAQAFINGNEPSWATVMVEFNNRLTAAITADRARRDALHAEILASLRDDLELAKAANEGGNELLAEVRSRLSSVEAERDRLLLATDGLVAQLTAEREARERAAAPQQITGEAWPGEAPDCIGECERGKCARCWPGRTPVPQTKGEP